VKKILLILTLVAIVVPAYAGRPGFGCSLGDCLNEANFILPNYTEQWVAPSQTGKITIFRQANLCGGHAYPSKINPPMDAEAWVPDVDGGELFAIGCVASFNQVSGTATIDWVQVDQKAVRVSTTIRGLEQVK
jgi:hypothetical protein